MASVRKRRGRYYVRYTDADGIRHESKGYTDQRVAEQKRRQIELEVEKIRGADRPQRHSVSRLRSRAVSQAHRRLAS